MKTQDNKKKVWVKPAVQILAIKKDTFSGSQYGEELSGKSKIPQP